MLTTIHKWALVLVIGGAVRNYPLAGTSPFLFLPAVRLAELVSRIFQDCPVWLVHAEAVIEAETDTLLTSRSHETGFALDGDFRGMMSSPFYPLLLEHYAEKGTL